MNELRKFCYEHVNRLYGFSIFEDYRGYTVNIVIAGKVRKSYQDRSAAQVIKKLKGWMYI